MGAAIEERVEFSREGFPLGAFDGSGNGAIGTFFYTWADCYAISQNGNVYAKDLEVIQSW